MGSLLIFLLVSPLAFGYNGSDCFKRNEYQASVVVTLQCQDEVSETTDLVSFSKEIRSIVTKKTLYPVYSSSGRFQRFVHVEGKYKKGLVLIHPGDGPPKASYENFAEFDLYQSNHYRFDLSCFLQQKRANVPEEKEILTCIDERIERALKKHGLTVIHSVSLKKIQMIVEESKAEFDTGSVCAGNSELVFFQGKV